MSRINKHSWRSITFGLGLALIAAAPLGAHAAVESGSTANGAPASTPWSQEPHRYGPPGKRWIHRYAHPVPEPEVRWSIRPRQYGPPSMSARSWLRDEPGKPMCCDPWQTPNGSADDGA
jgi:hypothetical protein